MTLTVLTALLLGAILEEGRRGLRLRPRAHWAERGASGGGRRLVLRCGAHHHVSRVRGPSPSRAHPPRNRAACEVHEAAPFLSPLHQSPFQPRRHHALLGLGVWHPARPGLHPGPIKARDAMARRPANPRRPRQARRTRPHSHARSMRSIFTNQHDRIEIGALVRHACAGGEVVVIANVIRAP